MEHAKHTATPTSQTSLMCQTQGVFTHTSVGAVAETDNTECRVALTPATTKELKQNGHTVYFQQGFANRAGFTDEQYKEAGAVPCSSAEEVYKKSGIILKVKPPQDMELKQIKSQQVVFCFMTATGCSKKQQQLLHSMTERKATVVSYNTLMSSTPSTTNDKCTKPVHNTMAEMTGYLAVQQAMKLMESSGKGTLFGQVTGTPGANVLVLGAGPAGKRAAAMAAAAGATVTVMDTDTEAMRSVSEKTPSIKTVQYTQQNLEKIMPTVDAVLGCVIPSTGKAPTLVSEQQMKMMQRGGVAVDAAASMGGNFATTKPTTIQNPAYSWNGITMYTATDITCLAPHTASKVISQSALASVLQVANKGWKKAVMESVGLQEGVTIAEGSVTNTAIATHSQTKFTPIEQVLESEIQKVSDKQQNISSLKQQLTTFRIQQGPSFTIEA
ncbi:uncharacterized protein LOC34619205 [Cyclospora cayetanensis]|uniref:Uncharacterized protein LOC34619205 n=2 Tax=Cyclospora cayetanensis TaxID=88456 RepID=A0A6P5WEA9_9EIME|nr:uncharacterized protein LOC34619205 [Cyclospora cayetanensis]OEH80532.1 alanine dehydrogenase [Cyclospora cayetanensis]